MKIVDGIIFLLILIFCFSGYETFCAQWPDASRIEMKFVRELDNYEEEIKKKLPFSAEIASLQLDADSAISDDEIRYLLGFGVGDILNAATAIKAVYYLRKKNKCSEISFQITPARSPDSVDLVVQLVSAWTFKKLKLKGMLLGKDMYRQYYLMEPGDIFDEHKHQDSVHRLIERFNEEGYLNASINDSFVYDQRGKNIEVTLVLNLHSRFVINAVSSTINIAGVYKIERDQLAAKVDGFLHQKLFHKSYSKALLGNTAESLERYLAKKGFAHPRISLTESKDYEQQSVALSLVIDLTQKKEFLFFGNRQFSRTNLLDALFSFGRAVWSLPSVVLAEEVTQYYKDAGFWQVGVQAREEENRLLFLIEEGRQAVIEAVILEGVHQFDPKVLAGDCFGSLLATKHFNEKGYAGGVQELMMHYAKRGFFDAKVIQREFHELAVEGSTCQLTVTIDEGTAYTIEKIVIDGHPQVEASVTQLFLGEQQVVCSQDSLAQQRQWLQERLAVPDEALSVELIRSSQKRVTVRWHVDLTRVNSRFGKTVIIGNDQIPAEIIMRELPYHEGDLFDQEQVRRSLERLRTLDLFDSVMLFPELSEAGRDECPVLLRVQPSDPFELRVRFGIGLQQMTRPVRLSWLNYKVGGTFIMKNPTNAADHLKIDFDATRAYREMVVRYERPWIMGYPLNFFVQGYSTKYEQPGYFTHKEGPYEVWQQGFVAGASHQHERLNSSFSAGIEWMKTEISPHFSCCAPSVIHALALDPALVQKRIPYLVVAPTFVYDATDDRVNPRSGSFTMLSIKGMAPLNSWISRLSTIKCLFEQSFFMPIRRCVVATRFRAGYIAGAPLDRVQLIERFYLGGAHSVRSYYPDCVPPLGMFSDNAGCSYWVPQGSKAIASANIELRFPLFREAEGAVFQDIGVLGNNPASLVAGGKLVTATGFGVRYNTPLGPLRFDIGWKLRCKDKDEHRFAWYLALGNVF